MKVKMRCTELDCPAPKGLCLRQASSEYSKCEHWLGGKPEREIEEHPPEICTVDWIENNGSYEARIDGRFMGMVSQSPNHPAVMNPGKWDAVWETKSGGLASSTNIFDTPDEAKQAWLGGWIAS